MHRRTDVIVIGAGQAGLAMSHSLGEHGIEHVVCDRGEVGERWRHERWPSLKLLSPNALIRLPGLEPVGKAPEGFMSAADFAATLRAYRRRIGAPVITGCAVLEVWREEGGFHVLTSQGPWTARAVVIATGACDAPRIPGWAAALPPDIHQLSAVDYRNPAELPAGGVLVIGASATGVQLAAEIQASGRPVTLAVGRHVRSPRRYRGRDLLHWLDESGFLYEPRSDGIAPDRAMALPSLQLIGAKDGRDIGLAELAVAGVRVAGRAIGCSGARVQFASSLAVECAAAELRRHRLLAEIDRHIAAARLSAPADPAAWAPAAALAAPPAALDLRAQRIATVVWATGFRRTYPWLKLSVLDPAGELVNRGGVTPIPGLYALGLPFMRHRSSAFIYGVGRDAEALVPSIARHLDRRACRAA
ncbi:MAG: flavin-containing monooxygenase [Paracoccaceae bacterium]